MNPKVKGNMDNPSIFLTNFDKTGLLYDNTNNEYPTKLYSWDVDPFYAENKDSTYYVYVHQGVADFQNNDFNSIDAISLQSGYWLCVKGKFTLAGGSGIVMERVGFTDSRLTLGGPLKGIGDFKYIDGCSDSLLIPPFRMGDPCLNALYFPPSINQTEHTHPSMRVGMVVYGKGNCHTPWGICPLNEGDIFIIHEGYEETFGTDKAPQGEIIKYNGVLGVKGEHKFSTSSESGMCVIAYHPDSDFGPTDDDHPMVNRTIVDGVPVNQSDIRTTTMHEALW